MTRQLGYSKKILDLLQEGPKQFKELKTIRNEKGKPVSAKVLSYNLSVLQGQGVVEKYYLGESKYPLYRIAPKEQNRIISDALVRYVTSSENFMCSDAASALFVFVGERMSSMELKSDVSSSKEQLAAWRGATLVKPEDAAEQLVLHRIKPEEFGKVVELYTKLVFLGFLLEGKEYDSPQWNAFAEPWTRFPPILPWSPGAPKDKLTGVPAFVPYKLIPPTPKDHEKRFVVRVLFPFKAGTIIELHKQLSAECQSAEDVALIFAYLFDEAIRFLKIKLVATNLDELSRRMIHRALYSLLSLYLSQESLSTTNFNGWTYLKLLRELRKRDSVALLPDIMRPLNIAYIWAPFLGKDYLQKLRGSEEASNFEEWFKNLKEGGFDSRYWLFTDLIEKALQSFIKWLRKQPEGKPIPKERDFRIDFEPYMRTGFLFDNHSRGKSADFYLEILEAINERKEHLAKAPWPRQR